MQTNVCGFKLPHICSSVHMFKWKLAKICILASFNRTNVRCNNAQKPGSFFVHFASIIFIDICPPMLYNSRCKEQSLPGGNPWQIAPASRPDGIAYVRPIAVAHCICTAQTTAHSPGSYSPQKPLRKKWAEGAVVSVTFFRKSAELSLAWWFNCADALH